MQGLGAWWVGRGVSVELGITISFGACTVCCVRLLGFFLKGVSGSSRLSGVLLLRPRT